MCVFEEGGVERLNVKALRHRTLSSIKEVKAVLSIVLHGLLELVVSLIQISFQSSLRHLEDGQGAQVTRLHWHVQLDESSARPERVRHYKVR